MEDQAMLTRDLVLRVCAGPSELDPAWIRVDGKVTTPFLVPRDRNLVRAIIDAGRAMGVDRLLVCRTRPQYSYEPVTQIPLDTDVLIDLVRGWGREPTDFLVCVEDFSAAVLVTSTELTVAAGPADFVRELVGADIPQARRRFGNRVRAEGGPELQRAAQTYRCLPASAKHARARGPGPDLAERLARSATGLRENAPGAVRAARALRGAWNWLMVAALLAVPWFLPDLGVALPVLLTTWLLLFQIAWASRSRTVSFATLLRFTAVGFVLVWPLALAEGTLAGVLGLDPAGVYAHTYIAVTVEELGKLAPLLLVFVFARRRARRLAAVDHLLLAAATGAGLQLAERLFVRIPPGADGPMAAGGILLPGSGLVAGPGEELTVFAGHAVTSGLVGGALGLAIVGRRGWLWALPVLAVAVAQLDHLAFNAQVSGAALHPATEVVHTLLGGGSLTVGFLVLVLVCAVATDYRLIATAAESTPPLPGQPPMAPLRRWTRGRSVAWRVRVPADIAPAFRRMALWWVELPTVLAATVSMIVHELTVALIALCRGPAVYCDTLRFLRWRRANAMGEARSRGREWRHYPSEDELTRGARDLARRIGLAATGGITGGMALALVFPVADTAPQSGGAYALGAFTHLQRWSAGLGAAEQVWVAVALVAVLSLLTVGNGVPHAHPRAGSFLRTPTANTGAVLGMLAPGQVGYALPSLLGLVLPRRVEGLLYR